MTKLLRIGLRLVVGLAALLSGCGSASSLINDEEFFATPTYGVPIPEHDPTVVLTDFSYTPASPIRVGDKLTFRVQLSQPMSLDAGLVGVFLGDSTDTDGYNYNSMLATLNDNGNAPDETALDGIWTGEMWWHEGVGPGSSLPIFARLDWFDGFRTQGLNAPVLTVLPVEEE